MAQDLDHSVPWLAAVDPEELRRIIDALYRIHQFIAVITDLDNPARAHHGGRQTRCPKPRPVP